MFDSSVVGNISAVMAFVEGLVSFFSPCVLPLLPIYLGYLSGSLEDEAPSRKKSLWFTIIFILGIFSALLLLNASITWISAFFQGASIWMMRIGGILIVGLGLIQMGIFKIPFLERTIHIQYNFSGKRMNVILAFLMGFTFSFSWTPCIGPALASILIMAGSSGSFLTSTFLVFCYAIGFALPFLIISFFAKATVHFFHKHDTLLQVIVKFGAVILIIMGMLMFSGHLGILGTTNGQSETTKQQDSDSQQEVDAPSFALQDQYGNEVRLSDYAGKIVYMNFWGTWCSACKSELDDLQKLYETYQDSDEVAILTFVYPNMDKETDIEGIKKFIKEHDLTFPVLFDSQGIAFQSYGISSFPTAFIITPDQKVFGYLPGAISYDMMEAILQQVREGSS